MIRSCSDYSTAQLPSRMLFFTPPHVVASLLLLATLLSLAASQAASQCDLENIYMLGDIAIPSIVDSEPMFADDYSKILSPEEQARESRSRGKRAAVKDRSRIWPNNVIPYVIERDFQEHSRVLLRRAMEVWAENTCIRFVPRTTEQDYLLIKSGRRCCSYVGRQKRGAQKMALDHGCLIHGILLHELGHVIGFWHEQNRPDRDEYIQVLPNYHDSVSYNFDKRNESEVDSYGVPYDYDSIMHYGETFFSIDGKSTTLLPLKENVEIGQRKGLSPLDILQANRLYMCQQNCSWTYNASERAGSFHSMNYPEDYPARIDCMTRILANPGQVIRLNFETINIEHHADCTYDYLEVRDGDLPTAPLLGRFCGNLPSNNFTSTGPNLWVKFHSDTSVSRQGFFAHFVALDVNECEHNNGGCSHICLNSQGSFTCHCPRGYNLGDNGLTCIDIDECAIGRARCSSVCINTPGSYYCGCEPGFRLHYDHITCVDTNECNTNNGGCEQVCTNLYGGHNCGCWDGFSLDTADNASCIDFNECRVNNGGCQQECTNIPGGHYCSCRSGFYIADNLSDCVDVDECGDGNNGGCDQICENTPGSFSCSCRNGFVNINSTHCEDVDECEQVQCIEGECVNEMGGYHCACDEYHMIHPVNPHFCIMGISNNADENLTEERNWFKSLAWSYNDPVCGDQDLNGEPGMIVSPHYPAYYPTNTECTWLLSGGYDQRVELTLLSFDLESVRYCGFDSLRIYDGATEGDRYLANLCGRIKNRFRLQSSGTHLLLKFKSDMINTRPGFKAAVDFTWVDKCGGKYVTGRQSRPISFKSKDGSQCMWTLTAPEGSSIFLNFIRFKFYSSGWSGSCTVDDAVEIYDTTQRTLIVRYCRSNLPPKLYIVSHSKITIVARALSDYTTMDLLLLHSATSLKYV
ncbi:hypothetical protein ACHWQZ_G007127 [Mnemiopsis leidyi]